MKEVKPTLSLLHRTHGMAFGERANRSKGITHQQARTINQRWEDRTDDIEVYYEDVFLVQEQMNLDAGLGRPGFFRNVDGNEQGRFPSYPCSCGSLAGHPVFANQGEDYDGDFDAMANGSAVAVQSVIDGAQRFWIRRARKIRDITRLPAPELVKHPRNSVLLREVAEELKALEVAASES